MHEIFKANTLRVYLSLTPQIHPHRLHLPSSSFSSKTFPALAPYLSSQSPLSMPEILRKAYIDPEVEDSERAIAV